MTHTENRWKHLSEAQRIAEALTIPANQAIIHDLAASIDKSALRTT